MVKSNLHERETMTPKTQLLSFIEFGPSIYLFYLGDAFSPQWEVPRAVVGYACLRPQGDSPNLFVSFGQG